MQDQANNRIYQALLGLDNHIITRNIQHAHGRGDMFKFSVRCSRPGTVGVYQAYALASARVLLVKARVAAPSIPELGQQRQCSRSHAATDCLLHVYLKRDYKPLVVG